MSYRSDPVDRGFAVTPHDTNNLAALTRGIYIGGAGDLKVRLAAEDEDVTLVGVTAGNMYPICAKRVFSTGTTATNIVALY